MEPLTLKQIADAVGGAVLGDQALQVTGICIDSREAAAGDLFIAVAGERTDGHRFLSAALQRGVAAALISDPSMLPVGMSAVVTADTVWALGRLAAYYRSLFSLPTVGVTGSAGKTTTKEMIAAVLSARHSVLRSPKNNNTEIGVPLAVMQLTSDVDVGVFEMGMRGRGQIDWLAQVVQPQIGVITNIGWAHVGILGNRHEIAYAKCELLHRLPPDGVAVLNRDDDYFEYCRRIAPCRVVTFGNQDGAMFRSTNIHAYRDGRVAFTVHHGLQCADVEVSVAGTHNVYNALAAIAVGHQMGVSLHAAAEALSSMRTLDMRMNIHATQRQVTVLDDTYNANPASMHVALDTLSKMANGSRRVVILGDMLELGAYSPDLHRRVGEEVTRVGASVFIAVGERAEEMVSGARSVQNPPYCVCYPDSSSAACHVDEWLRAGDVVLVKGSRGVQMEHVVEAI